MPPRRAAVLVALALAGGGTLPPAAGAVIVPQHGMAGVRLGMPEGQVRAALGPPVDVRMRRTELGTFRTLGYRGLTVTLAAGLGGPRVSAVSTRARAERTPAGIGVGSSERALRRTIARARCATEGGFRSCRIGALLPGRTVTDFQIRRGRVARVVVGVVID